MIKKVVNIWTIIAILTMFGLLVGMSGCIKKEVPTPAVPTVVPTTTPVNVVLVNTTSINTDQIFSNDSEKGNHNNGFYGGIAGTADKPPVGTIIDVNLTKYYGIPTAIGGGKTYWFVGGWGWFNETEMLNLPSASHMYGISPYDCEAYGCGGSTPIPVPVSIIAIIGFIAVAYIIWRKRVI